MITTNTGENEPSSVATTEDGSPPPHGHTCRPGVEVLKSMHWGFRTVFLAWVLLWIARELLVGIDDSAWPGWLRPVLSNDGVAWTVTMAALLLLEIIGLKWGQGKEGDTLSELVWTAMGEGWAVCTLAVGFAIALSLRVVSLPFLLRGVDHMVLDHGPWIAISAGMMAWLILHFPRIGGRS